MSCFSFYLFSFFFYEIREQEDGTGPAQGGWLAPVEGGEVMGKRSRRVNMVQKTCTHVCKCRNDTC
jgi:hypothetical protein